MNTLTTRQKLITYLADADESEIDALYNSLKQDIAEEKHFTLSEEQFEMLEADRQLYLNGESKSYTRQEANEIIKGQRDF
jgi:ParB-like chromosome segregation protein Spo0J